MAGRDFSSVPNSLPPFVGLSVLLGCCAILLWPQALPGPVILGLSGAAALCFLLARWQRRLRMMAEALWPACLAAAITAWGVSTDLETRWPRSLAGERVIGTLQIDSLIEGRGERLDFEAILVIESPTDFGRALRVRVNWRNPPRPLPLPGETWRVLLQLTPPAERRNPGGFDVARQAFAEGWHARAQVLPWRATDKIADAPPSLLKIRATIAAKIFDQVVDRDAAALFAGLAVGATEAVSVEQWRVFSVTGTTHLVAISGMHVTLFAWVMAGLARGYWRHSKRLMQSVERELFAGALGVLAAFGYALLAGFGVPTQRTVVMLAVWWAMRLSGRTHSDYAVLGLALVAVWLIDLKAPLTAGFWLSFVAMATLMSHSRASSAPRAASLLEAGQNLWAVQWRVGIALLPLTLAWFSTVSIAGLFVNLIAIPVFSFVLVPLVLLGALLQSFWAPLATPCWWVAEQVHAIIWPPMHAIAQSEWASASVALPPVGLMLAASAVMAWLWLPKNIQRSFIVISLMVGFAAVVSLQPRVPHGVLQVQILDGGDATAIMLRTRNYTIVYDTAEQFGSAGAGARNRVIPALREWGLGNVDLLVLGSVNGLRVIGAATLATLIPVKEIRFAEGWQAPPRSARRCDRAVIWRRDGVEFQLRPAGDRQQFCLLRAGPSGGPAVLIAERLDRAAAGQLAQQAPAWLASEVVVAPRRGSVRALDRNFVRVTAAKDVLVSSRVWSASSAKAAAAAWGIAPQRIHTTAEWGALTLQLAAGEAVVVQRYTARRPLGVWQIEAE